MPSNPSQYTLQGPEADTAREAQRKSIRDMDTAKRRKQGIADMIADTLKKKDSDDGSENKDVLQLLGLSEQSPEELVGVASSDKKKGATGNIKINPNDDGLKLDITPIGSTEEKTPESGNRGFNIMNQGVLAGINAGVRRGRKKIKRQEDAGIDPSLVGEPGSQYADGDYVPISTDGSPLTPGQQDRRRKEFDRYEKQQGQKVTDDRLVGSAGGFTQDNDLSAEEREYNTLMAQQQSGTLSPEGRLRLKELRGKGVRSREQNDKVTMNPDTGEPARAGESWYDDGTRVSVNQDGRIKMTGAARDQQIKTAMDKIRKRVANGEFEIGSPEYEKAVQHELRLLQYSPDAEAVKNRRRARTMQMQADLGSDLTARYDEFENAARKQPTGGNGSGGDNVRTPPDIIGGVDNIAGIVPKNPGSGQSRVPTDGATEVQPTGDATDGTTDGRETRIRPDGRPVEPQTVGAIVGEYINAGAIWTAEQLHDLIAKMFGLRTYRERVRSDDFTLSPDGKLDIKPGTWLERAMDWVINDDNAAFDTMSSETESERVARVGSEAEKDMQQLRDRSSGRAAVRNQDTRPDVPAGENPFENPAYTQWYNSLSGEEQGDEMTYQGRRGYGTRAAGSMSSGLPSTVIGNSQRPPAPVTAEGFIHKYATSKFDPRGPLTLKD